jgi:hypothetical protein
VISPAALYNATTLASGDEFPMNLVPEASSTRGLQRIAMTLNRATRWTH